MAETRGHQYQRGVVGIHCCGGLSHNHILGAQNFVVVEIVKILILCADFLHVRRSIYFLAMAETRGRQKQREGVGIYMEWDGDANWPTNTTDHQAQWGPHTLVD